MISVPRTSRFCRYCPKDADKGLDSSIARGSFKFYNNAWRTYTQTDIDRINFLLCKNDLECDLIPDFLNRFFPCHPLTHLALSFSFPDDLHSRGHPIFIQFQSVDIASAQIIEDIRRTDSISSTHLQDRPADTPSISPYRMLMSPSCSTPEFDSDVTSSPDSFVCARQSSSVGLPKIESTVPTVSISDLTILSLVFEFSSGLCVLRKRRGSADQGKGNITEKQGGGMNTVIWEALVIRREGDQFYEVAKGHLEHQESLQEAAERELREETGLLNRVKIGGPLLSEIYTVKTTELGRVEKTVHYFEAELMECPMQALANVDSSLLWSTDVCQKCCKIARANARERCSAKKQDGKSSLSNPDDDLVNVIEKSCCLLPDCVVYFGQRERETRDLAWVALDEVQSLFWKSNIVLNVVVQALTRKQCQLKSSYSE